MNQNNRKLCLQVGGGGGGRERVRVREEEVAWKRLKVCLMITRYIHDMRIKVSLYVSLTSSSLFSHSSPLCPLSTSSPSHE